ncbi:hypothetical protein JQC92_13920 [Shewanella sp. 202IG2-18]|uniref:hypothetical protein n=1 Tax=Parashewanella hymeniacidonis TaxID=2807618 RepID=UPI001961B40F|nr:hypothetical protein [Parashewanella hymeniacidonis]MBM7073111.1 hypothetical protein [Parashewanella hymeniacidonis]
MKVTDIVCRENGEAKFSITSMEVSSNSQIVTLVEVNAENTSQHLDSDAKPITISIKELQAFYSIAESKRESRNELG